MRGSVRAWLVAVILGSAVGAPGAWAPETRLGMVDEAVRLMPASLRLALERQREALLRGALEPAAAEGSADHRPSWSEGHLEAALEREAAALGDALRRPGPFAERARLFGVLAHYVADTGFPPLAGDGDDRRYAHFSAFCESRRARFPLVFYGYGAPPQDGGAWREFGRSALERARADDRDLARAYAAAGEPPAPAAFDDRSVPFAIGSLSYSRSVTNIARAWLAVWIGAGGDRGRTPYLPLETADRGSP